MTSPRSAVEPQARRFLRAFLILTFTSPTLLITSCNPSKPMNSDYLEIVRTRFHKPVDQALIDAVLTGDAGRVKAAIAMGGDPNADGDHGKTPLAVAVLADKKQSFTALLEGGADPNHRTPNGATPAAEAIQSEEPFYLQALLKAGLDPDQKHGNTPLVFLAVRSGNPDTYQALVEKGADLSTKTGSGQTLASTLINVSWYPQLKELIERGGDFRSPSGKAGTPAEQLIQKQYRFGGDPNADGYIQRVEILKMMRQKGLEIPAGVPGL